MSLDLKDLSQETLFTQTDYRTMINIPKDHRLVTLNQSIPWQDLMLEVVPILYHQHGIATNIGRKLNLRAHLGAYILQSVHNWTDRWTEEMLRYYVPARIFCGFIESPGSLDHTKIEEFRNRLGEEGSELISEEIFKIANKFGFTQPTDVDMDTTVQEAGITHPTEMKLLSYFIKKASGLHKKLSDLGKLGLQGIKKVTKTFSNIYTNYRFFDKTKEAKSKSIKKAVALVKKISDQLSQIKVGSRRFKSLQKKDQVELTRLKELTPKLLEQILYWLKTGNVAQNKIITLWKSVPRTISKGKIGKSVEFGRKWVINCYQGGYVLLTAPNNAKISDQHCVVESLNLHLDNFEESPTTYATDRGMWSIENITHCLIAGIKQIGLQPKGGADSLVSQQVHRELKNRRAGIEPRIAHLKQRGLGKSRMKSDMGDIISGHRSALSYNITHLWRDLNLQALHGVN